MSRDETIDRLIAENKDDSLKLRNYKRYLAIKLLMNY